MAGPAAITSGRWPGRPCRVSLTLRLDRIGGAGHGSSSAASCARCGGTEYGLRLAGKLALVAGLLGLAAVNRLVLTPRVARGDAGGGRALRRTRAADLALGFGVLAATASLSLDPPPRAAAGSLAPEDVTIVATTRDGHQAALTLVPGLPGANRLEAWVTDAAGAPVQAGEASVRVARPEAGIEPARFRATASRPGAYVAEGLAMPNPGRWRLRLDLLVDDFTRLTFEGEVDVGGTHGHGRGEDHRGHDVGGAPE